MSIIREARLKAGLTQEAMSKKLEIPKRTIENWEGGKTKPPAYVEKLVVSALENITEENN